MDISDFRIFKYFYEYRNLSQVAVKNNLSQPSVSYRIKKMEDSLGVDLFHYDGKFHFTDNGLELYKTANKILDNYNSLVNNISTERKLNVFLSSVAVEYFLSSIHAIIRDKKYYPVIMSTSSSNAIKNIINDQGLFAIVGGIHNVHLPKQVIVQKIGDETIVLTYNSLTPDDIKYIPILLDEKDSGLNISAREYISQFSDVSIIGEVGKSFEKLKMVEQSNIGIFLPEAYMRKVKSGNIRFSEKIFV
jgi:DNA-binding transcriptional LysR family regulator